MNVWLDDERPMPEHYHLHVKTADEAIAALKTGNVDRLAFDHDLGAEKTGYDVAKWIEEAVVSGELKELPRFSIHTANPVGRVNICRALQSATKLFKEKQDAAH